MQAAVILVLLLTAVGALLAPLPRLLGTLAPPVLAGVALASGIVTPSQSASAVAPLLAPLAFVLLAVPMAVLLDRFGFFEELAVLISGGRRYLGGLWLLAAIVTATLNLDAAVVLLTPLYLRVARRKGVDAFALALQPALLSGLASSALPVSNLTNLIAAGQLHLATSGFVGHLGLPTLAAVGAGWLAYRAAFRRIGASGPRPARALGHDDPLLAYVGPGEDRLLGRSPGAVLLVGGAFCAAVVAGFLAAPLVGGAPWEVAAVGDLVLVGLTSSFPARAVPWQSVVVVLGLGVLATGAARHLPVAQALGGSSPAELARSVLVSAAAANVVNNLPAVLVALPHLGHHSSWTGWSVLLGTNVGPLLVPSGSLAVLLWLATVRRLGLDVRDRHFVRVGWLVALPALAAATATLLVLRLVLGPVA